MNATFTTLKNGFSCICQLLCIAGFLSSGAATVLPQLVSAPNTHFNSELPAPVAPGHFLENKGQMADMNGAPVPFVLFKTQSAGLDLYITEQGLSYVFMHYTRQQAPDATRLTPEGSIAWERMDMRLEGASINANNVIREKAGEAQYRYFLGHCPDGVGDVHTYEKITIRNVYPGIDWVLYNADGKGLKYDFVLHPGADLSHIRMVYVSEERPALKQNGSLVLKHGLIDLEEQAPQSFQNGQLVASRFRITGNQQRKDGGYETSIGFLTGAYDHNDTLTIDPQLFWGTTFGGSFDDAVYGTTLDPAGNLLVTGFAASTNFPVLGVSSFFQGTVAAGADAIISKFSNSGVLLWSTYYGGINSEAGSSISTDPSGQIYVTGSTDSPNFPLQNAGTFYQPLTGTGAVSDAFILKFSNVGVRMWATCYGGSAAEIGTSIITDPAGNIVVCGATTSMNLPLQNAGTFFQPTYQGNWDGFILKFTNAGSRLWCSYYGGFGYDRANALATDASGTIYMIGESASFDLPLLNTGAFFQGVVTGTSTPLPQEAFFSKFSNTGTLLYASLYGGTEMDYASAIVLDKTGNVFVVGQTESPNFPVQNGSGFFQGTLKGGRDAYVLKFDAAFNRQWATYFGGTNDDSFFYNERQAAIDACGNLVFAMATASSDLPDAPACDFGSYQSTAGQNPGGHQLYLSMMSGNGDLLWGTYMGYDVLGAAGFVEIDTTGSLFVVTSTSGSDHQLPFKDPGNGAHYSTTDSYGIYISKFIQPTPFFSYPTPLCITSATNPMPVWNYGSAPGCVNTGTYATTTPGIAVDPSTGEIDLTGAGLGTYSISYTGCAGRAVGASISLTPGTAPVTAFSYPNPVCLLQASAMPLLSAGFTAGGTFVIASGPVINPATGEIDLSTAVPGTYVVSYSVAPHQCFLGGSGSAQLVVVAGTDPVLGFTYASPVCLSAPNLWPSQVPGFSQGGSYHGSSGLSVNSANGEIDPGSSAAGTYTVTYTTPLTGCISPGTGVATVTLLPGPLLSLSANVILPPGGSAVLTAGGNATTYAWTPTDGLSCSDCPAPVATPIQNTRYCVVASDGNCTSKACVLVEIVCPGHEGLSMPNAFTPNGDGINDEFCLQGWDYCVRQFSIVVFDQWGEKMFESNDPSFCWNGRFRGRLLDPAVFVYHIKAAYANGDVSWHGNISLLR